MIDKTAGSKLLGVKVSAPLTYDKSILVPVPRSENREPYNITNDDFVGYDVWNCFEVSFLLDNGMPVSLLGKLTYPSNTKYIVESKSLKLYLNSFNMEKMGSYIQAAKDNIKEIVQTDLSSILESNEVRFDLSVSFKQCYVHRAKNILTYIDNYESIIFKDYTRNANLLKIDKKKRYNYYRVPNLRSNCKVTHQPDWGTLYFYTDGDNYIEPESLLQYIASFRNENHFHEEVCEMIFKDIQKVLPNQNILVACLYTRRGGIDINPVRATNQEFLEDNDFWDAFVDSKSLIIKEYNQ